MRISFDDDRGRTVLRNRSIDLKSTRRDTVMDVTLESFRRHDLSRRDYQVEDENLIELYEYRNNKDYKWMFALMDRDGKFTNFKTNAGMTVRDRDEIKWEYRRITEDKEEDEGDKDKEEEKENGEDEEENLEVRGILNVGYKQEFIAGYPNGGFRPEREISREEVAQIIYRLLDPKTRDDNISNLSSYWDVGTGKWSTRPIASLEALDIIGGYPDGSFRPTRGIKRAEVAAILSRVAELNELSSKDYTDVGEHWAALDIRAVRNEGWIKGYPDGSFRPDKNITRAEFTSMINSSLARVGSADGYMINKFTDIYRGQWFHDDVLKGSNEIFE